MIATAATPVIEHVIGAGGQLHIRVGTTETDLRAIDGDTVRVLMDRDAFERVFDVVQTPDRLSLRAGTGLILSGIRRRAEASAVLVVEVPRGAEVVVESGSGEIRAEGLAGRQRYQTASGDLTLRDISGEVVVDVVSGDVDLTAVETLGFTARTVSGDLRVRAATLSTLRVTTTSGDVKIAGQLDGAGPFAIQAVSGDSLLALAGDATVAVESATGRFRVDIDRPIAKSDGGRRSVIIGRGGPTLGIRSLSGDVRLVPPTPIDAPAASRPPVARVADATPTADRSGERLDILRALERGEIDPTEAARRLDALDETDDAGHAR